MKIKLIVATFVGAALVGLGTVGCVQTVGGTRTAGVPFVKDRIHSRYQRPLDEVYDAARSVISENGVLVSESILHGETNAIGNIVKTIEGKVSQRTVWIRVEQIEPRITDVTTQARTLDGGADIDLAASIDKQIALKLVH